MSKWAKLEISALEAEMWDFGHPLGPPGVPHNSDSRAFIKDRLKECSNLPHRGMHAKSQFMCKSSSVRAMGASHLLIGGYLSFSDPSQALISIAVHSLFKKEFY